MSQPHSQTSCKVAWEWGLLQHNVGYSNSLPEVCSLNELPKCALYAGGYKHTILLINLTIILTKLCILFHYTLLLFSNKRGKFLLITGYYIIMWYFLFTITQLQQQFPAYNLVINKTIFCLYFHYNGWLFSQTVCQHPTSVPSGGLPQSPLFANMTTHHPALHFSQNI